MNSLTIIPNVSKLHSFRKATNLFNASPASRLIEEKHPSFAIALAHEIRNPLSNINLAADNLKSDTVDEEQNIYLDIIIRASAKINGLLTDFLHCYQLPETEAGRYSIHELLDEVLVTIGDRFMMNNISVTRIYSEQDYKIVGNKHQLKIALTNIMINAIDAMPEENGKLVLITKVVKTKCIIEIMDNGAGIPKKNLKKIFEPYFTSKLAGIGLGLSTSLNILQSNHVTTHLRSEEGIGTCFRLSFNISNLAKS